MPKRRHVLPRPTHISTQERSSIVIRILCFDIEGGHGGSSRSLYQSLLYVDRDVIAPEVIVRRPGAIEKLYADLEIPVRVMPDLPKASALQTWRATARVYAFAARAMWQARPTVRSLADDISTRFDAVHFNHVGYWMLAGALRRYTKTPFIMHVRTMGYGTYWTRFEARRLGRTGNRMIYISENEQDRSQAAGVRTPGTVIYNIAEPQDGVTRHNSVPDDGRFTVACLSNFSWERGVDRLIEIAQFLRAHGRKDIRFVVAGDMTLPKYLAGNLGDIGRQGGTLADYAKSQGVEDMFLFLGHVPDPERVLAAADLLIKPTREANPCGRATSPSPGPGEATCNERHGQRTARPDRLDGSRAGST
jgi:glycosyltransferase involved in cell wall biosynthesis